MDGGNQLRRIRDGVRQVVRLGQRYRQHFGFVRGWSLAVRDRPGASGSTQIRWEDNPPVTVRLGSTDLRTFCHVVCQEGYKSPFEPPIRTPKWIIDAGANVGLASVYFSQLYPNATVIAIEPDPSNFRILSQNVSSLSNVVAIEAALWSCNGLVDLADPGGGEWAYRVTVGHSDEVASTKVEARSVEAIMDQFGIDRIDIFKIDIEGGELELFADCASWIGSVEQIAIELHDSTTPGCTDVFNQATADFSRRTHRGEDTFVAR